LQEVAKIIIGIESKNRWYDNDATVSLAISLLRNAMPDYQIMAAKKIVELAKSFDVKAKDVSIYVRTFRRRWYDSDENLCMSMEYFREAPPEIQKKLAIETISYLCEIEDIC